MGISKEFRGTYNVAGSQVSEKTQYPVQTITNTTGTDVNAYGLTIIDSTEAGTKTYKLTAPTSDGINKSITVQNLSGSSSPAVAIVIYQDAQRLSQALRWADRFTLSQVVLAGM